jgi:excisionase family DNA binding protein
MIEEMTKAKWMNVRQAAEHINVSPSALYQYVSRKTVPFHRLPGSNALRFRADELDAWLMGDTEG